jgi:hypothetical protein
MQAFKVAVPELTFILRLLHMPHPRLGFPVYTIVKYK